MKIGGKKIESVNEDFIVLPRPTGDNIVLKMRAVLDFEKFHSYCPVPTAPRKRLKDQSIVDDVSDADYIKKVEEHAQHRINWIMIESLKATENLEWETVREVEPATWGNYKEEFKNSGISDIEVSRIIMKVMEVNSLSDTLLKEARERFLAAQQV